MVTVGLHDRPARLKLLVLLAVIAFIGLLFFPSKVLAAGKGVLWVRVVDMITGNPIPEAEVTFIGTAIRQMTDDDGEVGVELLEGKYDISILKDGFYNSFYQDVAVEGGKVIRTRCELVLGSPKERFYFGIGGINVTAKRDLLPEEIETTHEISSAEIEHYLSTNLGDILDMVPGVERTRAPGLSTKTQIQLRGSGYISETAAQRAALFGTKVIVDDITISNNANLQTGVGTAYGGLQGPSTSAGSGIDLRTIPADNIEKVEVVTGVPSVEHGDLITGIVKVTTKKERQPHRLKIKSNPDTKEANLMGGWSPRSFGLSYNVNYAYSERDIRRKADEYSRYNAQLTVRNQLLGEKLSVLNKFYYTGVIDETNLDVNDPLSIEQYNRDKTIIYGHTLDYKLGKNTKVEWRANMTYTKRDSYNQRLIQADTRVLTDATEQGTQEGVLKVGAYIFRVWTKGEEWNANAKLNFRRGVGFLKLDHSFLAGGEYTFDDNVGKGKIFNPFEPPYGDLGYRPLPFDAVPALHTANLYLEDDISGILWMRPYSVSLGLRYEMYRPFKLNLGGIFNEKALVESKNGSFINPRIGLKYQLFDDTRIRFGWGKSSKIPSMTTIFQGPEYIDIVEENVSPPDSTPLVSTYVFKFDNGNLRGYQSEKTELSLDQKIGPTGLILTGFYNRAKEIPRDIRTPIILYRYRWENWPDPASRTAIDTIYTVPSGSRLSRNVGWYKNYGFEFQLMTNRIRKISTAFRASVSFVKSRSGGDGIYMSDPRVNQALGGRTIYPFYYYTEGWRRKMIVDYKADWLIQKLGMWVTFSVQQTLFDANLRNDNPVLHAVAYYDPVEGRTVPLTPAGADTLGLVRSYDEDDIIVLKRPNDRFLFNINISKSLGWGSELSLFIHNVFDDAAAYFDPYSGLWQTRNHDIFYGVEFSMVLDELWRKSRREGE